MTKTKEELGNIAGGMISFEPLYELLHKNNITKEQLLKKALYHLHILLVNYKS